MCRRQKKYLFSFVVIGSILMLSFQNTLSVLHTLLHQIPNPIHHHGEEDLAHYHHAKSKGKSFFAHESHSHNLEDHVHSSQKEKGIKSDPKKKSEKSEKKKSSKTTWFIDHPGSFCFAFKPMRSVLFSSSSFFSRSPHLLLGPPPEIGA